LEHARVPVSVSIHLTSLPNLQVVRMGFDPKNSTGISIRSLEFNRDLKRACTASRGEAYPNPNPYANPNPNLQVVRMGFDINSANYDGQTSLHLMAKQVGSTVRMEASEAGCEWQCSSVHTD
jgi:hypothetical protein